MRISNAAHTRTRTHISHTYAQCHCSAFDVIMLLRYFYTFCAHQWWTSTRVTTMPVCWRLPRHNDIVRVAHAMMIFPFPFTLRLNLSLVEPKHHWQRATQRKSRTEQSILHYSCTQCNGTEAENHARERERVNRVVLLSFKYLHETFVRLDSRRKYITATRNGSHSRTTRSRSSKWKLWMREYGDARVYSMYTEKTLTKNVYCSSKHIVAEKLELE